MKRIFTQLTFMILLWILSVEVYGQNILIQVNSPASVAGQITTFGVTVGGWAAPLPEDVQINSDIVLANDGSASPTLGCQASPAGAYTDKIVFIRRGVCAFSDKVGFAETAGASAVIIVNNDQSGGIINMSAADGVSVGIPVFMVSFQTGEAILSALQDGPVNMTLELQRPDDIGIAEIYSPFWFNSFATPQSLINYDTAWNFASRIFNVSRTDADEVIYSVSFNQDGEEIIKLSETISLAARTDDLTYTPTFSIPTPSTLEPGNYSIVYSIESDAFTDVNPGNNTRTINFIITDGTYMQSTPEPNEIARICFESAPGAAVDCSIRKEWAHGALFTFPQTEEEFTLYSVNMVVGGEDGPENLENAELIFYWLEVLNFTNLTNGTGATLGDGASNNYAGIGEFFATPDHHNQEIQIPVTNIEEEPLVLQSNRNYAGVLSMPAGVLAGRSTAWRNVTPELNGFVYYWPNLFLYDGVFQSRVFVGGVYMKLNFTLTSTVDDKPLPEQSVKVFPNPAQDYTMVELDLPKAMNATITLADISGKVITTNTYQNVQRHTQKLNIGNLSAGTYIIRIATPEGTSTKKLLIVK